jgi:hypothetical protein
MRFMLMAAPMLLVGCTSRSDEEARFIAQFRADGVRACMRGEGLMQPHWSVPPERLQQSCECIVAAYTEGKTRRTLQHLTVGDELRARERCSNGAPIGVGPGDEMVNMAPDLSFMNAPREDNASGGK